MDELRESSLLFSLEGLLETERERVQREAREAQKRREEELARVAEQAARRRQADVQEREARARRQALAEERDRLDAERLDAMKLATVERTRVEAEGRLRLIEVEQARQHELSMSQLRERSRTARYRTFTWLSSASLVVAVSAGLAAYFGYVRPAQGRMEQQLRSVLSAQTELAQTAQQALLAERRKSQALGERVAQLEAQPVAATVTEPRPHALIPKTPGKPPTTTPPLLRHCKDTGDPLDGCIH